MAESKLRDKSEELAAEIVLLCRYLRNNGVEHALLNQLMRSGTSISANIHEAQYGHGTKDYISKFEIALKECNETEYWLRLLYNTKSLNDDRYFVVKNKCGSVRRMLISTITTTKAKNQEQK